MEFKKYQKIRKVGAIEVQGIFDEGNIYVFEKIDGSNSQIRLDDECNLLCGSRNGWVDETNNQFKAFYDWAQNHTPLELLKPNYILFGEWLVPHTVKYESQFYNQFYLFDIWDTYAEAYLPYKEVAGASELYELNHLLPFYVGEYKGIDHLKSFLGRTNFSATAGEGIVIKNYGFRNRFDRQCWAKMVTQQFQEKMGVKVKKEKAFNNQNEVDIINHLVAPARIRKIREKGRNGELDAEFCGDMRDMRWIPSAIYEDILDEDLRYIADNYNKVDFQQLKRKIPGIIAPKLKQVIEESITKAI